MDTEKYQRIIRDSNTDFLNWTAKKGYILNQVVDNSIMFFRNTKSIGVSAIELHNQYIKELENNFENNNSETNRNNLLNSVLNEAEKTFDDADKNHLEKHMKNKTEKYVLMVEGRTSPTKLHDNYELAEHEAKRLCLREQLPVYICKAVTKVELNQVTITKL